MNCHRGSSTRKRARVSIERSDERRIERLPSDGLKRIISISVVCKQFQLLSTGESGTVEPSSYMNTCYVNLLLYSNGLLLSTFEPCISYCNVHTYVINIVANEMTFYVQ